MCTVAGRKRVKQRYDKDFNKRRAFFRDIGMWPYQKIRAYQLDKLKEMAKHAYENVSYYKSSFDRAGFKPEEVNEFEDWKRIPIITKDDIRAAGKSLIASNYSRKKIISTCTAGTSGIPLTSYHTHESLADVYACFWEYHRPGVEPEDRYATFHGLNLVPARQKAGPYWRINKAMNQRLYSIFHMSEKTIGDYIADLDAYKPAYLAGYSFSLYLLAKLTEESSIVPKWSPKAVFTTSEQLLDVYRDTIERVFRTKVWDAYSQDEICGSISEYECGYYHYDHAYGYMEFDDIETRGDRRIGDIICTGFLNKSWPLLRYKIGDLVEYEPVDTCPGCGRAGPIIHKIHGRLADALVLPSGKYYPYICKILRKMENIREVQLVQKQVDKVIIKYVPTEQFCTAKGERTILEAFENAIDEPIDWSLEKVDEIQKSRSGKNKLVINEIENRPPDLSNQNHP